MKREFWVLAGVLTLTCAESVKAQISISVGTYGPRPYYGRGFHYHAYPYRYRHVVVPYYVPPAYGPILIEDPYYVPQPVIVEQPRVLVAPQQQYRPAPPVPAEQVERHVVPVQPEIQVDEPRSLILPSQQPGAPPPPAPTVMPNPSSSTANYRPRNDSQNGSGATIGRPVIPARQSESARATPPAAAANVPLRLKGKMPKGPTKPFYVTHKVTNQQFEVEIPAGIEPREIRFHRSHIAIKYSKGEITIEFERDGSAKVDYDF